MQCVMVSYGGVVVSRFIAVLYALRRVLTNCIVWPRAGSRRQPSAAVLHFRSYCFFVSCQGTNTSRDRHGCLGVCFDQVRQVDD